MPYKDPEKRREMKARSRAAAKAGKATAAGSGPGVPGVPGGSHGGTVITVYHAPEVAALRLRSATDILGLLEGQAAAVVADLTIETCARARTVGYLAGIILRAVETADLTARLESIEEALSDRNADPAPTPFRRFGS
jgi:hypothetical protein